MQTAIFVGEKRTSKNRSGWGKGSIGSLQREGNCEGGAVPNGGEILQAKFGGIAPSRALEIPVRKAVL